MSIEKPRRCSDHPVKIGDIISSCDYDATWQIVTVVYESFKKWDDDLLYYSTQYPYDARPATQQDLASEPSGPLKTALAGIPTKF